MYIGIMAVAWMPQAGAAVPSDEPLKFNFKIDSQPLGAALQELAKQCGVQIIFFSQVTDGIQARAVVGRYTATGALQILLFGSNLTFQLINPKTIAIRPLSATDPLDDAAGRSAKGGKPKVDAVKTQRDEKKTLQNPAPLDEVLVNGFAEGLVATRTDTPLREIPQTISIVSQEQIRQENYVDVGDALNGAIGVATQRTDSLTQNFFARGFPITTFHLDGGAALNSFDGTILPFLGTPDLSEFDRMEVLRGADGLFGGDGNPGATINLIRKRALSTPQATVSVSAGSWNNYRVEGDVTGPLGLDGALRGRLDVSFLDQQYFYDTADLQRTKIFGVVEYDLSLDTLLVLGGSFDWDRARPFVGGLPRYFNGEDPHLARSTGLTFDWANYDTQTGEIYIQLTQQLAPRWKFKINATSWNQTTQYDYGNFDSAFPPISNELAILPAFQFTARPNTLDQLALDATLTGSVDAFNRRIDIAVGADFLRFRGNTAVDIPDGGPAPPATNAYAYNPAAYPDPRLSNQPVEEEDARPASDQQGVFGSVRVYLSSALSVVGGARVSRDSASIFNFARLGELTASGSHDFETPTKATPYAGIIYDLDQHYSLYASYADIYQSNGLLRKVDGSFLTPVDGINMELGIKGAWNDGTLNSTFAVYDIEQKGLPLSDLAADATNAFNLYGCCYVSGGILRSKGAELELNGQLSPGWLIGTGYTYNTNYGDRDGDLSGATPRHLFKLWTSKELAGSLQRWTIGGNVHAQSSSFSGYISCQFDAQANCIGPSDTLFKIVQGSYAIVGLRASYAINAHWRLALNINNIFDRDYYQGLGSNLGGNWYGEPRNFLARIDGRY